MIIVRQSLLSHDGFHGSCVDTNGIVSVHLIGDVGVVHSRHSLANTRLHQSGQRRQHVDRRVDLPVVQTAVHKHLPLSNVAGQIWDGVGDVIVGHGQDRELSDRPVPSLDPPCTFVDGGQIRVHVPGVTTTAGHFFSGGGDLSQGVGVRGHVSQDHEDVLLTLVREILGGRQRQSRRHDTLDGGIVGQVQEQNHVLHGPVLLEIVLEESSGLHVHSHGTKHNREVVSRVILRVLLLHKTRLSANLGRDLVVRQTGRREQRQLLPSHNRVHGVQSGHTRLNHLLRVDTSLRVDRSSVDVQVVLRQHSGPLVQRLARSVEGTTNHLIRDRHLQRVTREFDMRVLVVHSRGTLEHLHNSLAVVHLQHLALSYAAVSQCQVDDLRKAWELHIVQNHQRSLNTRDGLVVNSWGNLVVPGGGSGLRC
mmetsp:Transcript_62504/g.167420  ORF Transcript_62504/g.167420 Transcript_62504/m.167420 type:complete len:421 (+) Transcript_62504:365-1627(+)